LKCEISEKPVCSAPLLKQKSPARSGDLRATTQTVFAAEPVPRGGAELVPIMVLISASKAARLGDERDSSVWGDIKVFRSAGRGYCFVGR
jgi:hypothetical protein